MAAAAGGGRRQPRWTRQCLAQAQGGAIYIIDGNVTFSAGSSILRASAKVRLRALSDCHENVGLCKGLLRVSIHTCVGLCCS